MRPHPPRICVVGSSNIDLTFRMPRLPRPGETLAGQSFQLGFGGKGANQAVMAARLGARVTMVSRVGRDIFGEQTVHNYQQHGIDTTHVLRDASQPTGTAAIVVEESGQNCILLVPGANASLSPDDVRTAASILGECGMLLCQLEVPVETTLEAFRIARAAGVRTLLNPAPAAPLPDELLRLTDLCVPNETETEMLTGQRVTTPEEARAAAEMLRQRGAGAVLVTLGARGVVLVEEGWEHLAATPVRAVDASGAGDAFIGSLAVFLLEGLPLRQAAQLANRAAALSVTRPGTQASFPTRDEIDDFMSDLRAHRTPPGVQETELE
ncbi:MAG TPA: ribokinase [Gemmataceae bacterium]|nr:ribokinase [Gemmataceae bacterium]